MKMHLQKKCIYVEDHPSSLGEMRDQQIEHPSRFGQRCSMSPKLHISTANNQSYQSMR